MAPTLLSFIVLFWIPPFGKGIAIEPRVRPSELIIGGNTTDIQHHPYQVSIWSGSEFRGSGALVGKGWVIAPASVVIGFEVDTLRVRAFSSSAVEGGVPCNISKVLIHPRFRFSNMTFDVAMLRLKRPLMRKLLNLASLARRPLPNNCTAMLSGWGSTNITSKMSDELLQAPMRTISKAQCQDAYSAYSRQILHTEFCAKAVDVYGPCWGDGGDLLVYRGKLYGLLSWNRGCYPEEVPSVFTDISSVRQWILKVLKRSQRSKSVLV